MWEDDKIIIIEKYTELLNSSNILLFGIIRENLTKTKTVFPIITFILERIETVIDLATIDKIWDAEIVLRSAMETFIKFMYIATAPEEEKEQKTNEFWDSLAEINSMKTSGQAKKCLQIFKDSEVHKVAFSPLILPEDIEVELRKKWPRKKRQEIERRWSFSEIVNEISMKYRGTPLESIAALSYGYRMSSHVIHGDETAIQIIEERNIRPEEDRDKAYRGHFLRLFSDCLVFTTLTGALTMSYLKLNKKMEYFLEIMQEVKIVDGLEAKYKCKVFEESYYDRYRSTNNPHS